jgi:glutamate synthase (NADPH/NADH) small chain
VTDPRGFLQIQRRVQPYRPVEVRRSDYRDVNTRPAPDLVREQARRCMGCGVPFCHTGCPLGNLIPDWNDLVHRDDWHAAIEALHSTNNFPEFTGKLCPAPCEEACVLTINDDPVTIKQVEMEIADRAWDEGWVRAQRPERETGRRVAVVGSGPAGLAAAQQLTRAGHAVTVLERDDRPGGLLRYGIPDFKLEKHVIDRRIVQMEAEGTRFETGVNVGTDRDVEELRASYDAVVLATGAQNHRPLTARGADLDGVHLAMPYLIQQNRRVAGLPGARRADHRRGQARGRDRRRRHERRLPRQRPARGRDGRARDRPRPDAARPADAAPDLARLAGAAPDLRGAPGGWRAGVRLPDHGDRGRARPRDGAAR